jgi:Domain of unknown function (DUF4062)
MPTVFLSSVAKGLEEYREAVYQAIEGLDGYHCVRMENFGARNSRSLSVCLGKVRECDIFIGIVGSRYGSIAVETGKSFTESEYDEALRSNKKILMFVAPEEFPVPVNLTESGDQRERQARFRARVKEDYNVASFTSEEELGMKVIQAINNLRDESVFLGVIVQGPTMTKLLFPFITNQAGFDTGVAISNISDDPFGTQKEAGTCTVHYYGRVAAGGPPPKPQTSAVIQAGEHLVFTLSGGGIALISATPGFAGYLIVECRFKATGLAFLSDIGVQKVGSCYIAQVI